MSAYIRVVGREARRRKYDNFVELSSDATHNLSCLTIGCSENRRECQEEVDDVQVQSHGSPDVLVIAVALDEVVGIIYNVATENNGSQATVNRHRYLAQREQKLKTKTAEDNVR
ncbi:hypothetical protein Leryth_000493 [Lithospermum erythrorhizon]|nr:hypothetical protein Leryth_000493 [Lithospermum erythrorhizon]